MYYAESNLAFNRHTISNSVYFFQYMEELIGSIIFCWVTCGVSIAALVEVISDISSSWACHECIELRALYYFCYELIFQTRDLYVLNVEPMNFMQYCCQWLLPALILQEETSNIKWVAKVIISVPSPFP